MKYITKTFELIIFFVFLSALFLIAPLCSNAAEKDYNTYNIELLKFDGEKLYYEYNNTTSDRFVDSSPMLTKAIGDTELMYFSIPGTVNKTDNYYVAANRFQGYLKFKNDVKLNSDYTYYVQFQMYAFSEKDLKDSSEIFPNNKLSFTDERFKTYDIFNNIKIYSNGKESNSCFVTQSSSNYNIVSVACPVDSANFSNFKLNIKVDQEPYKELEFETGVKGNFHYYFGFRNDVLLAEYTKPRAILSINTNGSDAELSLNVPNPSNVAEYCFEISNRDTVCGSSSTYTFSDLSNGTYNASGYAVYKDGSSTLLAHQSFSIADSFLPVARARIEKNGSTITVDASDSYGIDSSIVKYYFSIDGTNYVTSTNPVYNFTNLEYGNYAIRVIVEDELGRKSTPYSIGGTLSDPVEVSLGFFESIAYFFTHIDDFVKKFIDDFFNKLMSFLFPSEEFLSAWFYNVRDKVEEQLGFLSYPFSWTLTFLERFYALEDTGHYIISWPNIKVPNFNFNIISAGSYDLASLLQDPRIKSFHDLYFICLDGLILFSFFNLCLNKLNEVFGGNTVEYEITTSVDTITSDSFGNSKTISKDSSGITKRKRVP